MGFGIALIGYACLILTGTGGEIFAPPLLAYGFFLASRLNGRFLQASICSLFMFPRAIVQLLTTAGFINLDALPVINVSTFIVNLAAWLFMSFFWLSAVIEIAHDCGAEKLEFQARNRLVFTVMFIMLVVAIRVISFGGFMSEYAMALIAAEFILQYVVIIVNALFLHTCFVLITSEKQYEKDKQDIAKERAKSMEKQQKAQQEAKEKLEKRKK